MVQHEQQAVAVAHAVEDTNSERRHGQIEGPLESVGVCREPRGFIRVLSQIDHFKMRLCVRRQLLHRPSSRRGKRVRNAGCATCSAAKACSTAAAASGFSRVQQNCVIEMMHVARMPGEEPALDGRQRGSSDGLAAVPVSDSPRR